MNIKDSGIVFAPYIMDITDTESIESIEKRKLKDKIESVFEDLKPVELFVDRLPIMNRYNIINSICVSNL